MIDAMVRRPFSFWASLVIGVVFLVVLVHSFFRLDYINYIRNGPNTAWGTFTWIHRGRFYFVWHHNPRLYKIMFQQPGLRVGVANPATLFREPIKLDPAMANAMMDGFTQYFSKQGDLSSLDKNEAAIALGFPMWPPIVIVGFYIVFTNWRVLKRRRRTRQLICMICGYDLRASRDRCPECGSPILLDPLHKTE